MPKKAKRDIQVMSSSTEEKQQGKKSKSGKDGSCVEDPPATLPPPINFAEDSEAIEKILKRYYSRATQPELTKMTNFMRNAQEKMQSVAMCTSIKTRFELRKKGMRTPEVLAVMNRTVCDRKTFERADYRISSATYWKIELIDGGSETFSCFYDGDNEGSGSYSWSCGEDGEEDGCDFEDLIASDAATWERLGLTSKEHASIFYHCLCDCSIS